MKSASVKSASPSAARVGSSRERIRLGSGHMPIEWLDAMCWRLPSGKALAEFALQAGFLAPLILNRGGVKTVAPRPANTAGAGCEETGLAESRLRETR